MKYGGNGKKMSKTGGKGPAMKGMEKNTMDQSKGVPKGPKPQKPKAK